MSVLAVPDVERKRQRFDIDVPFSKAPAVSDAGSGDLVLTGYASTWTLDRDGEIVAPNAFDNSLQDYLKNNPIVLWQHDAHSPIGQVTKATLDATGLYVEVLIPNPGPDAADWQKGAYSAIRLGIVKTFSIGGFMTRDVEMGPDGPVFTIEDVELMELSCVSIPSNAASIYEAVTKAWDGTPVELSTEARKQIEQLIGFEDISDPELLRMDDAQRTKRYAYLAGLFAKTHNGAELPPEGAYLKVLKAQEMGADPFVIAEATLALADAYLRPEGSVDAKAGKVLSAATRTKLQSVLDDHKKIEDHLGDLVDAAKGMVDARAAATGKLQQILGIDTDDDGDVVDDDNDDDPNDKAAASIPDGKKQCPTCKGTGKIQANTTKCPTCQGRGYVDEDYDADKGNGKSTSVVEQKQLWSSIQSQLSSQGQVILGKWLEDNADDDPDVANTYDCNAPWFYLDDIDIDRRLAYFVCYGPGISDRYVSLGYSVGADGQTYTLSGAPQPVDQQITYVPKALAFMDGKGVLSAPSAAFAPRNTSWDGAKAQAAIKEWSGSSDKPNAKAKQAYLWQDGDGSTWSDLKYPVATVIDGELKCVLAGVSAAAARANQNNVDALKAPLTTLYARAAKQFDDSDLKPPWNQDDAQ